MLLRDLLGAVRDRVAELDRGGWLVMHFGTSGSILYHAHDEGSAPHARLVLRGHLLGRDALLGGVHPRALCSALGKRRTAHYRPRCQRT